MAVINLTEARIRDLPAGSGIWRDEQVKGLLVVCHRSTKTYAVQGDVRRNGRHVRTVRMKIDRCDRLGLREARNQAKVLMSQIQSGVDPAAKKPETGVTLKQALEHHLSEKTFRPSTIESYRYHLDKYLVRLRGRAVADITRADVREIYAKMKEQRGQTTASAAIRTLRALINTAMRMDETIKSNPVQVLRIPMKTNEKHIASRLANEVKSNSSSLKSKIATMEQQVQRAIDRGDTDFNEDDVEALQNAMGQIQKRLHQGIRPFRLALINAAKAMSEASMADAKDVTHDELTHFNEALEYFQDLIAKHGRATA